MSVDGKNRRHFSSSEKSLPFRACSVWCSGFLCIVQEYKISMSCRSHGFNARFVQSLFCDVQENHLAKGFSVCSVL